MRGCSKVVLLPIPLLLWSQIPPPPGRLVDIGGRALHIHCVGEGSPAVILEAGFPGSSLDWSLIQPRVATFTRVCSYDRAGFGWSDLGAAPRSAAVIANDLRQLLAKADVPAPYVLVGHSMGGLYVRAFARRHPRDVVGMALIDATHEDQWEFEPLRFWEPDGARAIRLAPPEVERPPQVMAILKHMWAAEKWKTGERMERESIGATVAEAQEAPKRLPAIPLAVVSAGTPAEWGENVEAGALKAQQLQRELAALSPLGKWIPVAGANHYVHLSQPEAVVEAIRQVTQAGRRMRSARRESAESPGC
ncbi:MAG: alpha/beta hydrolase [Bryobacteraceae bacterium]|nr:alpha/beta hydrolase [Bryobacteraceae bacterium]